MNIVSDSDLKHCESGNPSCWTAVAAAASVAAAVAVVVPCY